MSDEYDPEEEQRRVWPGKKDRAAEQAQKDLDERILYNLIQKLAPNQRKALIELLSAFVWGAPKR